MPNKKAIYTPEEVEYFRKHPEKVTRSVLTNLVKDLERCANELSSIIDKQEKYLEKHVKPISER